MKSKSLWTKAAEKMISRCCIKCHQPLRDFTDGERCEHCLFKARGYDKQGKPVKKR